jgi:hypothetical protein
MGKGGARVGAGRPKKGETRPSRAQKSKSRWVIETRINELLKRGIESAKQEAARLAVQLLPYDEPRLANVVAETTTTVTYVARIPHPVKDITEWQEQTKTLLLPAK